MADILSLLTQKAAELEKNENIAAKAKAKANTKKENNNKKKKVVVKSIQKESTKSEAKLQNNNQIIKETRKIVLDENKEHKTTDKTQNTNQKEEVKLPIPILFKSPRKKRCSTTPELPLPQFGTLSITSPRWGIRSEVLEEALDNQELDHQFKSAPSLSIYNHSSSDESGASVTLEDTGSTVTEEYSSDDEIEFELSPRASVMIRGIIPKLTPLFELKTPNLTPKDPTSPVHYEISSVGARYLARAKLDRLIEELLEPPEDTDGELFKETFMLTHQMIIPSTDLLKSLVDKFNEKNNSKEDTLSASQIAIVNILRMWLEQLPSMFSDVDLFSPFQNWMKDTLETKPSFTTLYTQLNTAFANIKNNMLNKGIYSPKGIIERKDIHDGSSNGEEPVDILDFTGSALAKQLTLIDHTLFTRIQPAELLNLRWTKKGEEMTHSPNVTTMISRFNEINHWIMSQIVYKHELKERVAVVETLILMANEMRTLKNYFGMMVINSSLSGAAIQRLKRTFKSLSSDSKEILENLQAFLNPEGNFQQYRAAIADCVETKRACIPFLGVTLSDLTSINENEHIIDGLVNFDKHLLVGKVLKEIATIQSFSYDIEPVKHIQEAFRVHKGIYPSPHSLPSLSEKETYTQSLLCEPRKSNSRKAKKTPTKKKRSKSSTSKRSGQGMYQLAPRSPRRMKGRKSGTMIIPNRKRNGSNGGEKGAPPSTPMTLGPKSGSIIAALRAAKHQPSSSSSSSSSFITTSGSGSGREQGLLSRVSTSEGKITTLRSGRGKKKIKGKKTSVSGTFRMSKNHKNKDMLPKHHTMVDIPNISSLEDLPKVPSLEDDEDTTPFAAE